MHLRHLAVLAVPLLLFGSLASVSAEPVNVNGLEFESWQDFAESDYFQQNGLRCGTRPTEAIEGLSGVPGDCAFSSTTPQPEYDPGITYTFQIVVHVIRTTGGANDVSDALINSQIQILNEDFLALAGTNGANGNDGAIQFQLATLDPSGNPTTGITRSDNTTWYNDGGSYWNTLAWDPFTYINVYTNSASGNLGYVPNLPQGGIVGQLSDRIVILWSTFGLNAPFGPPYNKGRTLTHEMGHYLGLWHPFDNGCGTVPACYTSGDFICDTNPEASPTFGCPGSRTSCSGQPAPFDNYMDYSDDLCMEQFTPEQVNRMRCTIDNWRPTLPIVSAVGVNTIAESQSFDLLHQNVPNPFGPETRISFQLPHRAGALLRVLDVTGRTVRTLSTGDLSAGRHAVTWDGTDEQSSPVAAGVYFYQLQTDLGSETRQMVKMK